MNQELHVEEYAASMKAEWDAFVDASRNGTFLFRRDYMDYHADRFKDCSLMVRRDDGRLVAMLPAVDFGEVVSSHGGLTYGGFIMPYGSEFSAATAIEALELVRAHYASHGARKLIYKAIPHIFHKYPSEEDIYAIFRCGGSLLECNVASTIDLQAPLGFNERSRRNLRKAANAGITAGESDRFGDFWEILKRLLGERYNTRPVHTLEEIELLRRRFPDNIRLVAACDSEGDMLAGTVLYMCGPCVHCQYIAASERGKEHGALVAVFDHVLRNICAGARYLDFGTCNEEHGRYLNEGLLMQKNGMGGRAIAYQTFSIDL